MPASSVAVAAAVESHYHVSLAGDRRTLQDPLDMPPMGFRSSSVPILVGAPVEEAEARSHGVSIAPVAVAVAVVVGGAGAGDDSAAWDSSGRRSVMAEETQESDMGMPLDYKDH